MIYNYFNVKLNFIFLFVNFYISLSHPIIIKIFIYLSLESAI
jgi:hypothetical protein